MFHDIGEKKVWKCRWDLTCDILNEGEIFLIVVCSASQSDQHKVFIIITRTFPIHTFNQSSLKEVKMYSEMIMGSVAVAYHPNNMKLHFLGKNKYNIDTQPLVSMLWIYRSFSLVIFFYLLFPYYLRLQNREVFLGYQGYKESQNNC